MSEKIKKTPEVENEEVEEEMEEKTSSRKKMVKKPEKKDTEKKEGFIKRTGRKIKKGMQEHPFWTAFGGAAIGSGATVAAGFGAKKLMENHRKKQNASYIPSGNENDLNPNM